MNRKPIYKELHSDRRIISAPNGLWIPQKRGQLIGTPIQDPWEDIHLACELKDAYITAFGKP